MPGRLKGKVIVVTGAGSSGSVIGNGKATAILYAREGAKVLCVDDNLERAEETCVQIRSEGNDCSAARADVTKAADCSHMIEIAKERYGTVNVLHNNVGIDIHKDISEIGESEWDQIMTIDLKSMMLTCRAAIPLMIEAGGGSIINISSVAAFRGHACVAYPAAKAGVIGLSISLASQVGKHRIRVNAIAPGLIYSSMMSGRLSPELRERRKHAGVIKDEGTPWDVAWAAVYLASDESRWVTGQVLIVDGGVSITSSMTG